MKTRGRETPKINPKMAYYNLRIGHSVLHRYGLFALEDIPADRRVIEYTGKRLTHQQVWNIEAPKDIYIAKMNAKWFLDGGSGGSGAQFVNHSCNPNLFWRCIRNRLIFFSRRKIRKGEELTVDYDYPVKLQRIPCRCGARQCRGTFKCVLS
jgi:SET domain-containing protein